MGILAAKHETQHGSTILNSIPFDATTKVACLRHTLVPSPVITVCVIPNQKAVCGTDDDSPLLVRQVAWPWDSLKGIVAYSGAEGRGFRQVRCKSGGLTSYGGARKGFQRTRNGDKGVQ